MRILIVEDEPAGRELLELYLSDFGPCDTAADGKEALAMAERAIENERPYDLVCMDVMMPEMDGMEALKRIRRLEFKHFNDGLTAAKIIMITAKDGPTDMTSAFYSGAEGYLTKPFSRHQLVEQLEKLGLAGEHGDDEPPEDTELAL